MEIVALAATNLAPLPAAAPMLAPSALATERFNAIMSVGGPADPASGALQATLQSAFATPVEGPQTLGGQILGALESYSTQYKEKWNGLAGRLDAMSSHPSMADMLRVQTELLQTSVHSEMVGKAVSRSTQNIDTLVRMS